MIEKIKRVTDSDQFQIHVSNSIIEKKFLVVRDGKSFNFNLDVATEFVLIAMRKNLTKEIIDYIDENYCYEIRDNLDGISYGEGLHEAYIGLMVDGNYVLDENLSEIVDELSEKIFNSINNYKL